MMIWFTYKFGKLQRKYRVQEVPNLVISVHVDIFANVVMGIAICIMVPEARNFSASKRGKAPFSFAEDEEEDEEEEEEEEEDEEQDEEDKKVSQKSDTRSGAKSKVQIDATSGGKN